MRRMFSQIACRGMESWLNIRRMTDDQLVTALGSKDLTDRVEARKELVRRGPTSAELVLKAVAAGKLHGDAQLVGMGVLQAHWSAEAEALFLQFLNDASPDVRRI